MKVHVCLDERKYLEKPTGKEIPIIRKRVAENWMEIEMDKLAEYVSDGYAMTPGHLVGGLKAEHCTGMQIFALDFDSKPGEECTFREVQEKCKELDLPISFAYYTYSSTQELERFRVVFACENLIEDTYIVKIVLAMLQRIFPKSDTACVNLDRMFLGGKELIYKDGGARIALVQLLFPLYEILNSNDYFRRNIRSFCNKHNILLYNNMPAMGSQELIDTVEIDGNRDNAIRHIIADSAKTSLMVIESKLHQSITCKRKKRAIDLEDSRGCQLLDDFKGGEDLEHDAKMAILTNMLHIDSGIKFFLDILEESDDFDSYQKWKRNVKYLKGYHPQQCSKSFCPYYSFCENAGTIVNTLARDRQVFCNEERYYSLEEAVACFEENLNSAFLSPNKGIHLIKAQTALGKTTAYIKLILNNPEKKFLIALPTNILKQQVADDLKLKGLRDEEIYVTESVQDNLLFPVELRQAVTEAHQRGFHNKTKKLIGEYYEEIKDNVNKKATAEACMKIMNGTRGIQNERVVVTTHANFVQMSEEFLSHYTIIIDEDILQLQFFNRVSSVRVEVLEELAELGIPEYSKIAAEMCKSAENEYVRYHSDFVNPLSEDDLGELALGIDDNLNDIALADSYVKLKNRNTGEVIIKYFCAQKLPKLKYIILSATLNERIYQEYFRGMLEVYMYPEKKARYEGQLIQYTYHSLGRNDLSNKKEVFKKAYETAGDSKLPIITFKENHILKELPINEAGLHFGNTTGINKLKGKNIGVIGTPYKVEEAYKLVACFLGGNINNKENICPRPRRIQYKNYSFILTTYADPVLQEVQLYSLESELEQCVGRARLLRFDCTVYVYSGFPCEQAEIRMGNYLL